MPSQPLQLYQGETYFVNIQSKKDIFIYTYKNVGKQNKNRLHQILSHK